MGVCGISLSCSVGKHGDFSICQHRLGLLFLENFSKYESSDGFIAWFTYLRTPSRLHDDGGTHISNLAFCLQSPASLPSLVLWRCRFYSIFPLPNHCLPLFGRNHFGLLQTPQQGTPRSIQHSQDFSYEYERIYAALKIIKDLSPHLHFQVGQAINFLYNQASGIILSKSTRTKSGSRVSID